MTSDEFCYAKRTSKDRLSVLNSLLFYIQTSSVFIGLLVASLYNERILWNERKSENRGETERRKHPGLVTMYARHAYRYICPPDHISNGIIADDSEFVECGDNDNFLK